MRRVVAIALLVGAVIAPTTQAQEAEIGGRVDSVIELELTRRAPDRVEARVTTTVRGTGLTYGGRTLRAYRDPIVDDRVTVRGTTYETITFGVQTP